MQEEMAYNKCIAWTALKMLEKQGRQFLNHTCVILKVNLLSQSLHQLSANASNSNMLKECADAREQNLRPSELVTMATVWLSSTFR